MGREPFSPRPLRSTPPPGLTHSYKNLTEQQISSKSLLKLENLDVILRVVVLLAERNDKLISSFANSVNVHEENRAMGDARDTAKKKKADEKKSTAKKPAAKAEAKAAPKKK
jgi:hypothetical protein